MVYKINLDDMCCLKQAAVSFEKSVDLFKTNVFLFWNRQPLVLKHVFAYFEAGRFLFLNRSMSILVLKQNQTKERNL